MSSKEREIPLFLVDSIDDSGGLQVKDKKGLHLCIIDYIEEFIKGNIENDNEIICYLIYGDPEKGVEISFEEMDDSFIIGAWDDSAIDAEWDDSAIGAEWEDFDGTIVNDIIDLEDEMEDINTIDFLRNIGADVYEIILQNDNYVDPLDKALEYFEEIEDYKECERIVNIKKELIDWLEKNK